LKAPNIQARSLPQRLAMEFGREVFGVPGNITQAVSFAPNLLIKQGAKLVTNAEDVIEGLPTPVRAALTQLEQPEAEQRNMLIAQSLTGSGQKNLRAPQFGQSKAHRRHCGTHRPEFLRYSGYAFRS
jgi:predicted Rossmann fold nucleotide-binding protein DprA/Smf involved in DNA uptake